MIHGLRQMSALTDVHKQVQECVSIKCDIYEILCPVSESQHNVSGACAREPAMFVSKPWLQHRDTLQHYLKSHVTVYVSN